MDSTATAATFRSQRRSLTEMYGHAYRAFQESDAHRDSVTLVYEVEDGSGFREDAANYFSPPESWWSLDRLGCEGATGRTLDIGCGAGRHALAAMRAGREVVGLEPSEDAVTAARNRGVDARVGGLYEPPEGLGTFDTILLLGNGLHLLALRADPHGALTALAELANPGAQLVGTSLLHADPEQRNVPPRGQLYRVRVEHRTGDAQRTTSWSDWASTAELPVDLISRHVPGSGWEVEEARHDTCDSAIRSAVTLSSSTVDGLVSGTGPPASSMAELQLVRLRKHPS